MYPDHIDPIVMAFMALAFLFTLTIIRTRTGPVVMLATGNGRNVLADRQALQLQL